MADASLFCCSEYFVSTDYNRSLTWKRKDLLTGAIPSRLQWTKTSSHDTKSKAKRCERREAAKSRITYLVVCSKNEGDPLGTSEVRIKNEHQSEDLVEVVVDLQRQLLLSKFCIERIKSSDDNIFFSTGFPNYNTLMAFWDYVKFLCRVFSEGNTTFKTATFPYLHEVDKERERSRNIDPEVDNSICGRRSKIISGQQFQRLRDPGIKPLG